MKKRLSAYVIGFILLALQPAVSSIAAMDFSDTLDFRISWPLTDPASGGTAGEVFTEGMVYADRQQLVNMEINHYSGPSNSQRTRITGNAWPASQLDAIDSVHHRYHFSSKGDNKLIITNITYDIAAASISSMRYELRVKAGDSETSVLHHSGKLTTDALSAFSMDLDINSDAGEDIEISIHPWVNDDPTVRTGKYLCLQNVVISGISIGEPVYDPAEVQTLTTTRISVNSALGNAVIHNDGGSGIDRAGFCLAEESPADTSDLLFLTEVRSGRYALLIADLQNDSEYFIRAFAENRGGVSYGTEYSFNTLDSLGPPTVHTGSMSNIMVNTAECSGYVSQWGGSNVITRGFCWNTSSLPDLSDSHSVLTGGIGGFNSLISGLQADTDYYLRAYATNSSGTSYGREITFRTQLPAPDIFRIVAPDGSGDHLTVQEAFDAVPKLYTGRYTIYVKNGIYHEKLMLEEEKVNVFLLGENVDSTILSYDDFAGIAGGTSKSYSVSIDADDFSAMNITFQNTVKNDGTAADQQGVALRTNGDRQQFYNCRILGYQDTYYAYGGNGTGRIYMKNCLIEGSVDFIFGRDIVLFDSCEIRINREGGTLTAASTEGESKYGLNFINCRISTSGTGFDGRPITEFILGRPWQAAPRTVFIACELPDAVAPEGWSNWNVQPALYAEYNCSGPGYQPEQRNSLISRQLASDEAGNYTIDEIFSRESNPRFGTDWLPADPMITKIQNSQVSPLPVCFTLGKNYPNPFNSHTVIPYELSEAASVSLIIYNIRGQREFALENIYQMPGRYIFDLDLNFLTSGIYFYEMASGEHSDRRKLLLLK